MDKRQNKELEIVNLIYDASLRPSLWGGVVEGIVEITGADKGNVMVFDRLNPDYFVFHSRGIPEKDLQLYQEGGFAERDLKFTGGWIGGPGAASTNSQVFGGIENYIKAAGDYYQDFLSKVDILYQCAGVCEKDEFRWTVLGMHRGPESGPFDQASVDVVFQLLPHLRRSLQIHRQMTLLQQQNAHLYRLLEQMSVGVVMLDAQGRTRYANPEAEKLLRQQQSLKVDREGRLFAVDPSVNGRFQALTGTAIRAGGGGVKPDGQTPGGVLALSDGGSVIKLVATIAPLSEMSGYADLASDGIAAAVFLSDVNADHHLSRKLLAAAYGLSDRECDVAEAFMNRAALEGVADFSGLTLASVRTYMKSIYEKMEQHSQAELMRLLMGLRINFEHIS